MLTVAHFLQTLSNYRPNGKEPALTSVVMDSREAQAGSLFVAEKGERADGHDFVEAAFANGAIAALIDKPLSGAVPTVDLRDGSAPPALPAERPFYLLVDNTVTALQRAAQAWYRQFSPRTIGITGSVGKTSTKELTHAVLSQRYRTFKSEGNRNSILGLPLTVFGVRPYHERAVLEMAMYIRGEIAQLAALFPPQVGVVTLIGPVHLERVGSMEGIVAAKQELIEALPADGVAILNKDDRRVMGMAAHTQAQIFTYGLDPGADLWADNIRAMGLDGVRFTLHYQDEALSLQVPLLGRHSVHTSLRAAAVGLVEGLSWEEIAAGLRQNPNELRLVAVPGPKNTTIIDDTYNANPESVMAALNLLHDLRGRHVAVLGDMLELGQVEESSHRLIGRRVADVAQALVTVGERAHWIAEEALRVGMPANRVHSVETTEAAVPILESIIQEDDFVLVKGSYSMRMDRIVTALGRYD